MQENMFRYIFQNTAIENLIIEANVAAIRKQLGELGIEVNIVEKTQDEYQEALRSGGDFNIEEIRYAIFETNGKLCVMKYEQFLPPARSMPEGR